MQNMKFCSPDQVSSQDTFNCDNNTIRPFGNGLNNQGDSMDDLLAELFVLIYARGLDSRFLVIDVSDTAVLLKVDGLYYSYAPCVNEILGNEDGKDTQRGIYSADDVIRYLVN